jgi:hypothetical protein
MGQPTLPIVNINVPNSPDAVADWIMRNVPSFVGRVPHEWTEAVITKLQRAYIADRVIREAFKKTRAKGMDFEAPMGYPLAVVKEIYPLPVTNGPPPYKTPVSPPTMGLPPRPEDWTPFWFNQLASQLETQYIQASMRSDTNMMEIILVAFLKSLWEYTKARLQVREAGRNVQVQEWEEFSQSVTQAYAQAQNLASNAMRLTRTDMDRLCKGLDTDFLILVRSRMPQYGRGRGAEGEEEGREAD